MIKKTVAAYLAASLIMILLSACGTNEIQTSNAETPADSSASANVTQTQEAPDESSASAETTPAAVTEKGLKRGVWKDGVYTNEFSGLKFTLPKGWEALSNDKLITNFSLSDDIYSNEEKWIAESVRTETVYDQVAVKWETGSAVTFTFQNLLTEYSKEEISRLTAYECFESIKTYLELSDRYIYTFDAPYITSLSMQPFFTAHMSVKSRGTSLYYFLKIQGNYLISIMITISDDTDIDDIIAWFDSDTPVEDTESAETQTNLKRGVWNDGVYTNQFSGIKFTLPKEWQALTDEQLASVFDVSSDIFNSEEKWLKTAKTSRVYDAMAVKWETGNSIMFLFDKVSLPENSQLQLARSIFYNRLKEDFETDTEHNYKVEEMTSVLFELGFYTAFHAHEDNTGMSVHFYFCDQDDYMIIIAVTLMDNANITIDDIEDQFELHIEFPRPSASSPS